MKIAIINFYLRMSDYPTKYSLSTLRLAEYLSSMGKDVELLPISLEQLDFYDFVNNYLKDNYNIVCISHYVWSRDVTPKLITAIKHCAPNIRIIVGGPEVQYMNIDDYNNEIFIVGEGEEALLNSINYLESGRKDENFFENNENIFDIRHKNWKVIEKNPKYKAPLFTKFMDIDKDFLYYETSRGCAYKCGYCGFRNRDNIFNFPLEFIKEEIIRIGKLGFKEVFVVDANLGGTKDRAKEILSYFNQYAKNAKLTIYLRPEFIDDELIEIMKESNLKDVRIGIQTLNSNVPKWLRSNSIYHIMNELPKLSLNNIPWKAELIIGLPGDNLEGLKYTIKFTEEMLKPKEFCCYPLTIIKNTPLFSLTTCSKDNDIWIRGDENLMAIESSSYSHNDLIEMQNYAQRKMNEYLINSSIDEMEKQIKIKNNRSIYKGVK